MLLALQVRYLGETLALTGARDQVPTCWVSERFGAILSISDFISWDNALIPSSSPPGYKM